MNKFKKATKRIAAVGVAAAYAATTALAGGLGDYPSNFVKDDKFDGKVIIGDSMDSAAANTVIAALKSEFANTEDKYKITYKSDAKGGESELVEDKDRHLYVNEILQAVKQDFDDKDFDALADGTVEDENNEDKEYEYEQKIILNSDANSAKAAFGRDVGDLDDETNVPVPFLDVESEFLYDLEVKFKDTINKVEKTGDEGEGLVDSEEITMFGSTFTFDPNIKADEPLRLFSSSKTVVLDSEGDNTVTLEFEGKDYEVEMIGANSNKNTVQLRVNGKTDSVKEGDTATIGGLKLYVKNVFVNDLNNDMKTASAEIFLGSDEIEIPESARSTDGTAFDDLEINGDTLDGYQVAVETSGSSTWNGLEKMTFRFTPSELEDEVEYLTAGGSIQDPVFTNLRVDFDGVKEGLEAGSKVKFNAGSKDGNVKFTNVEGDDYTLNLFTGEEGSSTNVSLYNKDGYNISAVTGKATALVLGASTVYEDNIFIFNSDETEMDEEVTGVYEVLRFIEDDGDHSVEIRNMVSNDKFELENGDEIEDTRVRIAGLPTSGTTKGTEITFTGEHITTNDYVITENGVKLTIDLDGTEGEVIVSELVVDDRESISSDKNVFEIRYSAEDDSRNTVISRTGVSLDNANTAVESDEDNDNIFYLTKTGTYAKQDDDEESTSFEMWVPETENSFDVSFNFGEAGMTESVTVFASDVEEKVAELEAEGYTVLKEELLESNLDVEFDVTSAVIADESTPVIDAIVVGGPAANVAARELLGIDVWNGEEEQVKAGNAVIEYFETENSVLVYGWSKEDTIAGVRKLNEGDLSGNKVNVEE